MEEDNTVIPTEQETAEETATVETNWEEVAGKHQKAFSDQKLRAEKAESRLKELETELAGLKQPQKETETPKNDSERIALLEKRLEEESTRTRLTAMGVLEQDEQDEVIRAASVLGKSTVEALKNPLVARMLEDLRSQKKTEDVTPSPSGKGGSTTSSVERIAQKVVKGEQSLADLDKETKSKVLKHIEDKKLI